ncbi:hypothetical protein HGRIS_009412 [Hohenbuehelia grisea]|uniref:Alpha/beta hydrolase fold-3 domain-containing protein n=1 Tax=Hohenbuehelia grisea TaxID=104357 RepID=A0ABR3J122_9AGAR
MFSSTKRSILSKPSSTWALRTLLNLFSLCENFSPLRRNSGSESPPYSTNTHVPAPYWAAVAAVLIPLSTCNRAADVLIDWFGPLELKQVVGGERWWQVRGLDGIDAEWVTQAQYLNSNPSPSDHDRKLSTAEETVLKMDHLNRVMLYVHGGGYFWGSINTHRYQIIRYARKIRGRVFAVNYRKAPQYPWPCPLHDVIAAYMYLIEPPPGAMHTAVPPNQIVFAGDSAGGALCLTALTVIRDMGVPLPAGAVLISPWVDLTHSFPSVMNHTETDIIPEFGFLAKPSVLWPVDPIPPEGGRVTPAKSSPPPEPGHSDTLKPTVSRAADDAVKDMAGESEERVQSQAEMLEGDTPQSGRSKISKAADSHASSEVPGDKVEDEEYDVDRWEPKPPKVRMKDDDAIPLEMHSQIQLYAMTEQLTHPLVSPILQGSLGNLPPLYILAGDKEVLRDEIMYLAHRAANPGQFPTRKGVIRDGRRQKENAEKFTTPTKVHLQVYDGMCHVLTVFSFSESAKYAYRAIAEFVKHVTDNPEQELKQTPFPELGRSPSAVSVHTAGATENPLPASGTSSHARLAALPTPRSDESSTADLELYEANKKTLVEEVNERISLPAAEPLSDASGKPSRHVEVRMIRERVDVRGRVRAMEPKEEIDVLKIPPSEVGLIKEEPTLRWLKGQELWDKRYKRAATNAVKQRQKLEAKAKRMLEHARDEGLLLANERPAMPRQQSMASTRSQRTTDGEVQPERRWGPLDLDDEQPPPSAIAKRRDTPEALALLKKCIYHTAPVTHQTIPKRKVMDAVRAAFDPHDNPVKAPKQSVSEQQTYANIIPMHGLRIWDSLVSYFARKSSRKAINGTKQAAAAVKEAGEQLQGVLVPDTESNGSKPQP